MSAQIFILQELVMDHLEEGGAEYYTLSAMGARSLKSVLPRVLGGKRPKEELEALLGLALALEDDFNSPNAAAAIFSIVRDEPLAQEQIAVAREQSDPILVGEAFERFLDSTTSLVAPYFGSLVPDGFFPIRQLREFTLCCHAKGVAGSRYMAGTISPR